MIALIIYLTCVLSALGTGFLAARSDVRGMIIPNMHSVVVIGSFFLAFFTLSFFDVEGVFSGLPSHVISAGIVFIVTVILFALGSFGGGDSKLLTAFAFWVGLKGLLPLLFYMALSGGLLALYALYLKKNRPFKGPQEGSWVAQVQAGKEKVPYGVAIVFGALVTFIKLGYVGVEVFSSF